MVTKTVSKCVSIREDVDVDIEIDLDDFTDDDLINEMQTRNLKTINEADAQQALMQIRDALKMHRETEALAMTRNLVCDIFGCVL